MGAATGVVTALISFSLFVSFSKCLCNSFFFFAALHFTQMFRFFFPKLMKDGAIAFLGTDCVAAIHIGFDRLLACSVSPNCP